MCLYPKLVPNPKYKANKKNNGNIPELKDERLRLVAIGCGNCEHCRKMKAREWQVRLQEEIKDKVNKHFITLTFSDESIKALSNEIGDNEANDIASLAVRRFTERWRKKYKKAPRHWLITELGHPTEKGKGRSTERLHIHGIILEKLTHEELEKIWGYGWVHIGYSCDTKTVNYCVKYITKVDNDHKGYKAKIFASKGLGKKYINTSNKKGNEYKKNKTNETYRLNNGYKTALPIYYRNKIYNEEERENLWLEKLDKNIRYIGKSKFNMNNEEERKQFYIKLEYEQRQNIANGYGDDGDEWKKQSYEATLNDLNKKK